MAISPPDIAQKLILNLEQKISGSNVILTSLNQISKAMDHVIATQGPYLKFVATLGKGNESLLNLEKAYAKVKSQSDKTLVSMREMTQVIEKFSGQGFAQFMLAGTEEAQSALTQLRSTIKETFGDPKIADEFSSAIFKASSGSIATINTIVETLNKTGASSSGMETIANLIRSFGDEGAIAAQQIDGMAKTMETGLTGSADAAKSVHIIQEQITANWENMEDAVIAAFGPTIVQAISLVTDAINFVSDSSIVVTTITSNLGHLLTSTWYGGAAAIQKYIASIGYAMSSVQEFLGFTETAQSFLKTADELNQSSKENWDIAGASINKMVSVEEALENHEKSLQDAINKKNKAINEQNKALSQSSQVVNEVTDDLKKYAEIIKTINLITQKNIESQYGWLKGIDYSLTTIGQLSNLIDTLGNNFEIAGRSSKQFVDALSSRTIGQAISGSLAKETDEMVNQIELLIAEKQAELSITSSLTEQNAIREQINALSEHENKLLSGRVKATQALKQVLELSLAPTEADLSIVTRIKSLEESRLEIVKNLYGGYALSVTAQKRVLDAMQAEKTISQQQLSIVQEQIADYEHRAAIGENVQGALLFAQQKELDLRKQIVDKTNEQLRLVRELRDGYLDAVQASLFAGGTFEKFIITQDKNIATALDKGFVNKNYLLGQVGADARRGNQPITRFGPGGIGDIQGANNLDDYFQKTLQNVADPQTRRLMAESMAMVRGMYDVGGGINDYATQNSLGLAGISGPKGSVNEPIVQGIMAGQASGRIGYPNIPAISGGGRGTRLSNNLISGLNQMIQAISEMAVILDEQDASTNGVRTTSHRGKQGYVLP